MVSKRSLILSVFSIAFIFIFAYFLFTLILPQKSLLSSISTDISVESDVVLALRKTIAENGKIQVKITENGICYWIKPSHNGTHSVFQINKYKSTIGKCLGLLVDSYYIERDKGFNVIGSTCVCEGKTYLLEWEVRGVKITER